MEHKSSLHIETGAEAPKPQLAALGKDPAKARRIVILLVAALAILAGAVVLPSGLLTEIGHKSTMAEFLDQLGSNVADTAAVLSGSGAGGMQKATVMRYIAAFVAGGALGVCGAVYQGTFKNPLASPSTLGIISGCLFGSTLYYLCLMPDIWGSSVVSASQVMDSLQGMNPLEFAWAVYGAAICAIAGGLIVAATALFVSRAVGNGALGNVVLIVVGQVFTLVLATVANTFRYFLEVTGDAVRADLVENAQAVPFTAFITFRDLLVFLIPLVILLACLMVLRTRLNLLSLSDDIARSSGMDVDRFRTGTIVLCTAATGIVVGFCGPIAFVGFVSPHVARRLVGPNLRYLMPMSLVIGSIFVMVVLFIGSQLNIDMDQGFNLIATFIGCIVFFIVAFRGRGGAHAWK